MKSRPLILASASPRRQELLSSTGISFEVLASEVDEGIREKETPEEYVARLARQKAEKAGNRHKDRWVLAADTVVVVDGRMLGKPGGPQEAREMLGMLSGREHRVITGFCLVYGDSGKSREETVTTRVRFKKLSPREIDWYLGTGEPFDKAGAYAIQGKAAFMVKEIEGSYTNVVGLPLTEVIQTLQEMGALDPSRLTPNHPPPFPGHR
ncbi:MAG: Maf family protein [Planctomycetaceae bacterium]